MNTDFQDAHHRHWHDAETLYDAQRWANADHLYGVAAECGLKRLMLAFGMRFDVEKNLPTEGSDRKHIDKIWVRFETYRAGRHQGAGYALSANPFEDWDIAQRYAPQSHFDQPRAQAHRSGADEVRQLIEKAQREWF